MSIKKQLDCPCEYSNKCNYACSHGNMFMSGVCDWCIKKYNERNMKEIKQINIEDATGKTIEKVIVNRYDTGIKYTDGTFTYLVNNNLTPSEQLSECFNNLVLYNEFDEWGQMVVNLSVLTKDELVLMAQSKKEKIQNEKELRIREKEMKELQRLKEKYEEFL